MLSSQEIASFQRFIHRYYQQYGRTQLPWRSSYDPYQVLVSEIMLQQTQVERVIPKFLAFLEVFPTVEALATASPAAVIRQWQGLGYNRRGLNLQRAAAKIVSDFGSQVPSDTENLVSLPGIGPYTASAIQAFAFNQPSLVIETNIRTIMIYHFFHGAYKVEDKAVLELVEATLDLSQPRQWYSALMDYGAYLKQVMPNPSRQSKTYVKQSKFEGSLRQVRGAILKQLTLKAQTPAELASNLAFEAPKISQALEQLMTEGFLEQKQGRIQLTQ